MNKKESRKSYRKRITIMFIVVATLPVFLLGSFLLFYVQNSSNSSLHNALNDSIDAAHHTIRKDLDHLNLELVDFVDEDLLEIVQRNAMDEKDKATIKRKMYQFMGRRSKNMDMYLLSKDGGVAIGTKTIPFLYQLPKNQNWGIFRQAKQVHFATLYPVSHKEGDVFTPYYAMMLPIQEGYIIVDLSSEFFSETLINVSDTSYGLIQYMITSLDDYIIFNQSEFVNQISFVSNMMNFDQVSAQAREQGLKRLSSMDITYQDDAKYDFRIYGMIDTRIMQEQNGLVIFGVITMALLVISVSGIIGYQMGGKISTPIVKMAKEINKVKSISGISGLPLERDDEVGVIAREIYSLMNRVDDYHQLDLKKEKNLRMMEFKALTSQLNPHFLNNTLDSIKWKSKLYEIDDVVAMVSDLSKLMQTSMNTDINIVSVSDEIEFIETYIRLQKRRYGERFNYKIEVDVDIESFEIPKLILQPLVENAIIHGIEPLGQEGNIHIKGWADKDFLYFSVTDDGVGSTYKFDPDATKHIGLSNVHQRIRLYYGDDFGLKWYSEKGKGTMTYITIPKNI